MVAEREKAPARLALWQGGVFVMQLAKKMRAESAPGVRVEPFGHVASQGQAVLRGDEKSCDAEFLLRAIHEILKALLAGLGGIEQFEENGEFLLGGCGGNGRRRRGKRG